MTGLFIVLLLAGGLQADPDAQSMEPTITMVVTAVQLGIAAIVPVDATRGPQEIVALVNESEDARELVGTYVRLRYAYSNESQRLTHDEVEAQPKIRIQAVRDPTCDSTLDDFPIARHCGPDGSSTGPALYMVMAAGDAVPNFTEMREYGVFRCFRAKSVTTEP